MCMRFCAVTVGQKNEIITGEVCLIIMDQSKKFSALSGSPVDADTGLKNSGSEEAYITLLKVFYESIPERIGELNSFLNDGDIRNYTIRVHALKSSARLIGAAGLGEDAQKLEYAGKAEDTEFIKANHEALIRKLAGLKEPLSKCFSAPAPVSEKTEVDTDFMNAVFEGIRSAAEDMDSEKLDEILDEMKGYGIPAESADLFKNVKDAIERYEYKRIIALLRQ